MRSAVVSLLAGLLVLAGSLPYETVVWAQSKPAAQSDPAGNEEPRLNILLLYADDWRHDTLGSAGHPLLRTPHLDQLARDGIRFTHNYVTTSICGVSRASLLTGQWMSRHGNRAFDPFLTPWSETFPGLLREQGYWVGHVGKWHNGPFPKERYDFGRAYGGTHWMKDEQGVRIHVTARNVRDALTFLKERPADKPFCLTVSFFATHAEDGNVDQYLPQPESMPLFAKETVPIPKTATDDHFRRLPPFLSNEQQEGRKRWHWRFDTPEKYQKYMKAYFRLATEVDSAAGSVLAELKRQGIDKNTIVIFLGDNGYFYGEHGLADKWYPYQESIRVPLIVKDPRIPAGRVGKTEESMVLNVDVAPMILRAAGITPPASMQGKDFSVLYSGRKVPGWRMQFYYEHPTIQNLDFIPASEALVRTDWKYIIWPDFNYEELFDLRKDPYEMRNLAKDPAFSARLKALRGEFEKSRKVIRGE